MEIILNIVFEISLFGVSSFKNVSCEIYRNMTLQFNFLEDEKLEMAVLYLIIILNIIHIHVSNLFCGWNLISLSCLL